jgi:hypothetical protein
MAAGTDPETAVSALAPGLLSGAQAALLLEAPMPAGAGAAALATGLAQGAWMLRQLAVMVPGLAVTARPGSWRHRGAQLPLAEAFITAAGKPEPLPAGQDAADAAVAGLALAEMLAAPGRSPPPCGARRRSHSTCWRRWRSGPGCGFDPAELHADVLVVAARPEPPAARS